MGTQFYAQANNGINPNNGYDFKNWGSYGPQPYDIRFVYNLQSLYQLPFYKSQKGFVGKALGGWAVAPFFTMHSGYPLTVYTNGSISDETLGQGNPNSGSLGVNAVLISPYSGGASVHGNVVGANGTGSNNDPTTGGTGLNLFANPDKVFNQFRPFILGIDGPNGSGAGPLRGQSRWNLDLTVSKELKFTERFNARFIATFSNIMNHPWFTDPYLDLFDQADFGSIYNGVSPTGNIQINSPRQIEFGLRVGF